MAGKTRQDSGVTIAEAVETLSNIAELDLEDDVGVAEDKRLELQGVGVDYRVVHWLSQSEPAESIQLVRETFRAVLHYLQSYYKGEIERVDSGENLEGVKTIMVLVGEAAKKLDRYTTIFRNSKVGRCVNLREYKALQRFYKTKLAKRVEGDTMSRWIRDLPHPVTDQMRSVKLKGKKASFARHVFVDLDTVRRDTDYELFFIRKADGGRFYHPRLIRNIQLVCDFGTGATEQESVVRVEMWEDKARHVAAVNLVEYAGDTIDQFYQETCKLRKRELIGCVHKALMALFLSANPANLLHHKPVKSCREYFADFQTFLRDALGTRSYRKYRAYPPGRDDKAGQAVMELLESLCQGAYVSLHAIQGLSSVVQEMCDRARPARSAKRKAGKLSEELRADQKALDEVMTQHPYGPLSKLLAMLQKRASQPFDPWMLGNLPAHMYDLFVRKHRVAVLRIPSPTWQDSIDKAIVTNEFKAFLNAYAAGSRQAKHLLINLQDRTSWREHRRCKALEELQQHESFKDVLTVVTLPKDTDFYHQLTPYHNLNHADKFVDQFNQHLQDPNSGFYFSEEIRQELFGGWSDVMLAAVHRLFFDGRNVLQRSERLDFIELFYTLLQLKIVDLTNPSSMSFTCKDAIDVGGSATVQMFLLQKLWSCAGFDNADREYAELMMFMPALLYRERATNPERVDRVMGAMTRCEAIVESLGSAKFKKVFRELINNNYDRPLHTAKAVLPHHWEQSGIKRA